MTARKPVPPLYWALWIPLLGLALVVFYGILTPFWMLLRALAWVTEHPFLRRRTAPSDDAAHARFEP